MGLTEFHPRFFKVTQVGDIAVARFEVAHLNDEENIEELGHELFAIVDQFGFRKVVVTLKSVEYLTSSVIGKFITLHRKLHRSEGTLVLCEVQPAVNEVLVASRLVNYFRLAPTEAEAVTSLGGAPA